MTDQAGEKNARVVALVTPRERHRVQVNEHLVTTLNDLLKRAMSGELTSIIGIAELESTDPEMLIRMFVIKSGITTSNLATLALWLELLRDQMKMAFYSEVNEAPSDDPE